MDVRAATEQYAAQNEVRGFRAVTGSMPAGQVASSQTVQSQAATSKDAPPWAKK